MFLYVLCMNLQKYMSILSVYLASIVQALISLELDKNIYITWQILQAIKTRQNMCFGNQINTYIIILVESHNVTCG